MLFYRCVVLCLIYCFLSTSWALDAKTQFKIYAYIPWKINTNNINPQVNNEVSASLFSKGLQPVTVIYENNYFSHGTIDLNKIKNIALKTSLEPNIPVSFDMEFGNRFKPETVIPQAKTILKYFRRYNTKSAVGLYALIPQNTYGLKTNLHSYHQLNSKYDSLIDEVDFLSPSLYNYNGHDFNSWFENARFVINKAKQYKPRKPIIPYISPIIRIGASDKAKNGNLVEELSEKEMSQRLQALRDLGASGCILWASSQDRTRNGQFPQFNPAQGWGKAVVDFVS